MDEEEIKIRKIFESRTHLLNPLDPKPDSTMKNLILLILNVLGSISWIDSYISGEFTGYWVIVMIVLCVSASIYLLIKLILNNTSWDGE